MDWIRDEGRSTPAWRRYAAALLFVLLASVIIVTLRQWLTPAPLGPFFAAVALAAWYGGSGPAIVAIALSLAPISLVALEPMWAWSLTPSDQRALVMFVLVSGLLVLLSAGRDRTERELKASERRFRGVLETATEGVWLVDRGLRTQFANPQLATLLGTSLDRIRTSSILDFVFPEDVATVEEHLRVSLTGTPEVFDFRFRRADGQEVLVLASTGPVRDDAGAVVGALGLYADITARKQAEEALRTSQERLQLAQAGGNVGIWDWDAATDETHWSETMWEIYGLAPGPIP